MFVLYNDLVICLCTGQVCTHFEYSDRDSMEEVWVEQQPQTKKIHRHTPMQGANRFHFKDTAKVFTRY